MWSIKILKIGNQAFLYASVKDYNYDMACVHVGQWMNNCMCQLGPKFNEFKKKTTGLIFHISTHVLVCLKKTWIFKDSF